MSIVVASIAVDVVKKNIKNLHLAVLPPDGRVRVSAPSAMSDESIAMFVRTRLEWIRKQQEKFARQPRQSKREYVSGETFYVWGKPYYLQVRYSYRKNTLILDGDKAILSVRPESTVAQREAYVDEWYRCILKAEIEKTLPRWEHLTGIACTGWQTKKMTTRWGTCSTEKKFIWLNLLLARMNYECLDYVVLHELAHLVERTHNDQFVSIMDQYMPYWRETRKRLNDSKLDYMAAKCDL